mgnify:CR=1 FL=1
MPSLDFNHNQSYLVLIFLVCLLTANSFGSSLDEIRRSGKIYVAFTSTDLKNINYDLAQEFARYLNVELIEVEDQNHWIMQYDKRIRRTKSIIAWLYLPLSIAGVCCSARAHKVFCTAVLPDQPTT